MRITIEALGWTSVKPNAFAEFLLNSFDYAETGSADNKIVRPSYSAQVWKSTYGTVVVSKDSDSGVVVITMDTLREDSLVAKALGVFEHFMCNSTVDIQEVSVKDVYRNIDIKVQDLSAENLCKLVLSLPVGDPKEWWDSNVLPILEKIW